MNPIIADSKKALVEALVVLPSQPTREQIDELEAEVLRLEGEGLGVPLPTWHYFADGLAARTILIPIGTCLVGAAHRAEHLLILSGDISVLTEHGMRRLTGYYVLPSKPGMKRVGYAHDDTFATTVHVNPDNERDVAILEERFVEKAHRLQSRRLLLPPLPTLKEITSCHSD
jgi:hypothetical protein